MAIAASLLRSEMRRHLLMNVSLVASCVVGGTVVTNERGLFVPLTHGMSESARAFAAMFTQSHLLPDGGDLTDVRMVSPLSPFEVTADSRDLRRRLMDSLGWLPEQASEYNKELAQISNQTLTPTELASNTNPVNYGTQGAPAAGSAPATSTTQSRSAPSTTGGSPLTGTRADVLPTQQQMISSQPDITRQQAQTVIQNQSDTTGAVPEPSTWAMLIAGFGMVGYFLRNARRREEATEANG